MTCRGAIVMGIIIIIWIILQQSQKGSGYHGMGHSTELNHEAFTSQQEELNRNAFNGHIEKKYLGQLGEIHHQIIHTLKDIHEIFTKGDVWYVIQFGTLLGAVRHHGIIPWDDDADLVLLRRDRKKLWALKGELEKRGYRLESTWKLDRIYCNKDKNKEIPFIDLFYVDFDKNGKSKRCMLMGKKFCEEVNGSWWWKTKPSRQELMPRKLYNFNGIQLYGPANAKTILEREYGSKVLSECKSHDWDHVKSRPIQAKTLSCGNLPKPQLP